jgi:hypothetical protein
MHRSMVACRASQSAYGSGVTALATSALTLAPSRRRLQGMIATRHFRRVATAPAYLSLPDATRP